MATEMVPEDTDSTAVTCVCCSAQIVPVDKNVARSGWVHRDTDRMVCDITDEDGHHPYVAYDRIDEWISMVVGVRGQFMRQGVTIGK